MELGLEEGWTWAGRTVGSIEPEGSVVGPSMVDRGMLVGGIPSGEVCVTISLCPFSSRAFYQELPLGLLMTGSLEIGSWVTLLGLSLSGPGWGLLQS